MSNPVISVESLSKSYRLGQIGTGTISHDLNVWWAKARGKPNPMLKIGQTDHGNRDGETLWALKDVSFQVEQGEVLGIIGRNGAGKSTLLKILSRVTAPTSGCVKVKGRIASLLEVGTGFHPDLTGRENIYLNGAILGMSKEEVRHKFDEIVAFSEIEQFIDTPVKRYSSGMYVRLAFAVAAHLDPEILIIDEVLAVGDVGFQKKCLGKMGEVAEEGRTVVFVSHNMRAVRALCPKSVILDKGKIRFYGSSETAIQEHISDFGSRQRHSGVFDIALADHSHHAERIRFLRVSICTADGKSCESVPYKQPFLVRVEVHFMKAVSNCRLGIGINTGDEFRVATVYNTDCGDELRNFTPGPATWEVFFPNNILTPGLYRLGANVMTAVVDPTSSGEGVEHIPTMVPFTVSDMEPGSPLHSTYAEGPVTIIAEWSRTR